MRQNLLRQPAEFTAGIRVHDGPKTGNRRRLPRAHRNRRGRCCPAEAIRQAPEAMQPKSGGGNRRKGDRQPKIRSRNRRKTVDSRKPGGGIEQAETTAKRLTAGNRHKAADHRKPDGQSRCKGDRQPKIRCRNRRKTVDSRKPGGRIEQAETAAKRLTAGNRHKAADHRKPGGQSRRKTIDSRNRSAGTIDNRKSGRRELPETAAARPLRRISRDGPRRRIPLQT